jgi:hypothetical protein
MHLLVECPDYNTAKEKTMTLKVTNSHALNAVKLTTDLNSSPSCDDTASACISNGQISMDAYTQPVKMSYKADSI